MTLSSEKTAVATKAVGAARSHLSAVALLAAGLAYLWTFVAKGWVPFDEGQLGQSAVYVLNGALPHVDYQESYTGGLSYLYGLLFALTGVELLHIRWLLFAGAAWCLTLVYLICRRYVPAIGAALATWVALVWSFPNYFAGLPSWWLLICAMTSLWALLCYSETGRWRFLVVAGMSAGLAFAIKQTGAYLIVAVALTVTFVGASGATGQSVWLTRLMACAAVGLSALLVRDRLMAAEGVYLVLPLASLAVVMWSAPARAASLSLASTIPTLLVAASAALPVTALLLPYAWRGGLDSFFDGAFLQPLARVSLASYSMPALIPGLMIGLPLYAVALATSDGPNRGRRAHWPLIAALGALGPLGSRPYHAVWQAARMMTLWLPAYLAISTARGLIDPTKQRPVFACLIVLACTSLNQFPLAAPVYFVYTTPLLVVSAVVCLTSWGAAPKLLAPWGLMLTLFGLISLNPGSQYAVGREHDPVALDAPLGLPRANLTLLADHANGYRAIVQTINAHIASGWLAAGPDCPEMFFLTSRFNPSGVMYEFMARPGSPGRAIYDFEGWRGATVIVINHSPDFSQPLAPELITRLRGEFPHGTQILWFEVRWR